MQCHAAWSTRREEHATRRDERTDEKRLRTSGPASSDTHSATKHNQRRCTALLATCHLTRSMAATLPVGQWSWHERWLYPNQIADLPDRPMQHAAVHQRLQQHAYTLQQQQQQQQQQQYHQQQHYQQQPSQQFEHEQSAVAQSVAPLTLRHLAGGLAANNPQAALNLQLPSVPRRYRDGTLKRTTSEYCATYRDPESHAAELAGEEFGASRSVRSVAAESGLVPGSRLPARERGRMTAPRHFLHHHQAGSGGDSSRLRPEQHSFRLWGRINNAHCVVPYETSSQRDFAPEHLEHRDPIDTSRHMRIEAKAYTEALAKAKFTQVIRGDRAK